MENLKIFFLEDTELAEYEAINKGYRNDAYVKVLNTLFNVKVYDIVRLQQDFESEIKSYGYYSIEPNLILVEEVSKEQIELVVKKLYEQQYFDNLKPINDIKLIDYFN
ncbi:hypothetical protein J7E73_08475 [Paenibacillus albidus]|uniref:hypothetical protein n=1 Tax=Paenibacillus albidus TaxID=2041023 RepID=UPI001BE9E157|nr:hypothetical protein [Paenibacillus albidus]MBT2289166.1 hypothetical protein [Paenibacillus albidus]